MTHGWINVMLAVLLAVPLLAGPVQAQDINSDLFDFAEGTVAEAEPIQQQQAAAPVSPAEFQAATAKLAREGDAAALQALLDRGMDVNMRDSQGRTALMAATYAGHAEMFFSLLEAGADVNVKAQDGGTALMSASVGGNPVIVRALLDRGADVNARNAGNNTGLMWAVLNGHLEVVQLLLNAGADTEVHNQYGFTALMASEAGDPAIMSALIKAGADVDATDKNGATALIGASVNGYLRAVEALLAAGADVNVLTNDGKTALSVAKEKGHKKIVKLLKKAGAKRKPQPRHTTGTASAGETYRNRCGLFSFTVPKPRNSFFVSNFKLEDTIASTSGGLYEEVTLSLSDFGEVYRVGLRPLPVSEAEQVTAEGDAAALSELAEKALYGWRANFPQEPEPVQDFSVDTANGEGLVRVYLARGGSLLGVVKGIDDNGQPILEQYDTYIAVMVVRKDNMLIYATAEDDSLMSGGGPVEIPGAGETDSRIELLWTRLQELFSTLTIGPGSSPTAAPKSGCEVSQNPANADEQFSRGVQYFNGEGVPQDFTEAARWFERAAAQGHLDARVRLGRMYLAGRGVRRNTARGLRLLWDAFKQAEKQGNMEAAGAIGMMYSTEQVKIRRNPQAVVGPVLELAEAGDSDAQALLALMYWRGSGMPANLVESYRWMLLSATGGNPDAEKEIVSGVEDLSPQQFDAATGLAQAWQEEHPNVGRPVEQLLQEIPRPSPASWLRSNQARALESIKTIVQCAVLFTRNNRDGAFPGTLEQLRRDRFSCGVRAAISGLDKGYRFNYQPTNEDEDSNIGFWVTAVPVKFGTTGKRSFFSDESGTVHYTDENRPATDADAVLK